MTVRYRLTPVRRLANAAIKPLIRLGLGGRHTYILNVRGRRTGRDYSTPVTLIEDGERWLVAPYGEVSWVRNARAAGEVRLRRARRSETLRIEGGRARAGGTDSPRIPAAGADRTPVLRCHAGLAA